MVQFTMRTLALIIGLLGVVLAFLINLLYSSLHVLGRITGITSDQSHFFWGLIDAAAGVQSELTGDCQIDCHPHRGSVEKM